MSTVTYAGFSRVNNELKFRTANDEKRIFQLEKLGDTDINIVALPTAMSKSQAAEYCLTAEFFANKGQDVQALFKNNIKDAVTPAPKKVVKSTTKPVAKKPQTVIVKNAIIKTQSGIKGQKTPAQIRADFMKQLAKIA